MLWAIVFLFFTLNPTINIQAKSKEKLESKLNPSDLNLLDKILKKNHGNLNIFDKYSEEIKEKTKGEKSTEESSPFEHFIPVDPDDKTEITQPRDERGNIKKHKKKFVDARTIEKWKEKFNEKYTISLPILIVIMVFTVCVTCCCTLCLRKRLVALSRCCSSWRKKKTTSDKDIEKGKKLLKFKRTKPAVTTSMLQNRARSLSEDYVDRGIQNVELSVAREMTPPVGCCACCKKKRKQKRNK